MEELEKILGTECVNFLIRSMLLKDEDHSLEEANDKIRALVRVLEKLLSLESDNYDYRDFVIKLTSRLEVIGEK